MHFLSHCGKSVPLWESLPARRAPPGARVCGQKSPQVGIYHPMEQDDVYCVMARKNRVTLYLRPEVHERLRRIVDQIPGMSHSMVVEELLLDFLPVMEDLLEAAKSGDRDAQAEIMKKLLADQMFALADEGTDVMRQLANRAEEAVKPK